MKNMFFNAVVPAALLLGSAVTHASAQPSPAAHTVPGITYKVLRSGNPAGQQPNRGNAVRASYEGRYEDGAVFDRSPPEGRIFPLKAMNAGFQAALMLMRPGDLWEVRVPPELAYGLSGPPPVGGKTLIFKIELFEIGTLPREAPPFLSEMPK